MVHPWQFVALQDLVHLFQYLTLFTWDRRFLYAASVGWAPRWQSWTFHTWDRRYLAEASYALDRHSVCWTSILDVQKCDFHIHFIQILRRTMTLPDGLLSADGLPPSRLAVAARARGTRVAARASRSSCYSILRACEGRRGGRANATSSGMKAGASHVA